MSGSNSTRAGNARKAKRRAQLRMQRKPVPNSSFVPVRRYAGHVELGNETWPLGWLEDFRFVLSDVMRVMRE